MCFFLEVYNLVENCFVVSNFLDSVCGVFIRNVYCESSVYFILVQQCIQLFCVQICLNRIFFFDQLDLLIVISLGLGICVVIDVVNVYFNSCLGEFFMFFVQIGQFCYVMFFSLLCVGVDEGFIVSFWVWIFIVFVII